MTKFSILSLIAAALTFAPTASNLQAQAPSAKATFRVPFAFEVGTVHFAPGAYTLGMLNGFSLEIRGAGNSAQAAAGEQDNHAPAASKVVFRRVGDKYFLGELWQAGCASHLTIRESKPEKQARQAEVAANHPAAPDTAIALAGN